MRIFILFFIIIFVFVISYIGKKAINKPENRITDSHNCINSKDYDPEKNGLIVSLAPSITEILFELDLGHRIIGVTRYCDFPPAALAKTNIGGYYDPNYEYILKLQADLIIMLSEHKEPQKHLSELGLNTLVVDHKSIAGILDSITTIGNACGAEQKAKSIVYNIESRLEQIKKKTEDLPRPKVMIVVEKNTEADILRDVCISGRDGFYDEMIKLAGGLNVYEGNIAFPLVSREGIINLNPDIVIDIITDLGKNDQDTSRIPKIWKAISQINAVINERVYILKEDYLTIPGPRFILITEKMASIIHPEIAWEQE